ncbi:MAG: DUF2029 domain-containing protein [Saprospiraceae bacterium]
MTARIDWPSTLESYVLLLLLLISAIGLGYWADQSSFEIIGPCFGIGFLAYFIILAKPGHLTNWRFWLLIGILLRTTLLFGMPTLSDDIYRFIWDGRLWLVGEHPFAQLPQAYMEQKQQLPGIHRALFDQLNSPAYFTIYPPFAQGTFVVACALFFNNLFGASLILKLILLACEIGSLIIIPKILSTLNLPQYNVLIYALNPLVIVEVVGNLHYEGALVFFFLCGMYALIKQKQVQATIFYALSILSKLLTILFLPFLWSRMGWRKSIPYYIGVILLVLLCFLPLYNAAFINGFGSSIDLYFRKFEFNASIFYLLRWVGYQSFGYNIIQTLGPKLGLIAVATIALWGLFDKKTDWPSFFQRALFGFCLYLFLATTVHPWYTILPLALCLFTNYRFPIIWSALATLTYINYSYPVYTENLWMVGLEYSVVWIWLGVEWYQQRKQSF